MHHPFITGVLLTTIKTSAADAVTQFAVEHKSLVQFDMRRNAMFTFFGFSYLGCWQYYLYNHIFERTIKHAVSKVVVDQCLHHPFMYFPAFYWLKARMSGKDSKDAVREYKDNILQDLVVCWGVWVPAQYVNFRWTPLYGRLPFVASVSFGWTCLLSYLRGQV